MHISNTELKRMLDDAVDAIYEKKMEATEDKDAHKFVIRDSHITMTLLLAFALAVVQLLLAKVWIGFFVIIHSLMTFASAFLLVMLWAFKREKTVEVVWES